MFEIRGSFLLRTRRMSCRACRRFRNFVLIWRLEKRVSQWYVPTNAKIRSTAFLDLLLFVMLQTNVIFTVSQIFDVNNRHVKRIITMYDTVEIEMASCLAVVMPQISKWSVPTTYLGMETMRNFLSQYHSSTADNFFMYNNKCL